MTEQENVRKEIESAVPSDMERTGRLPKLSEEHALKQEPVLKRFRHEYKYMIDARQDGVLWVRAMGVLQLDPHVRADGTYLIRSLYFDDMYDSCLMENVSGSDPRSKFRIRYYNSDTSRISLEKKSKIRGMCLKESCGLSRAECEMFLRGEDPVVLPGMSEMKKKLLTEVRLRCLRPKTIVTYERAPFVYPGGNVRVTFDRAITSSEDLDRFLTGDYVQRPVLPCGSSVLEVKWDEVMPKHIKETLSIQKLNWTAFSKYFMCRMFHL